MDGRNFDALARRLGERISRRGAIRTMLGGAVAVAAGSIVATGEADAAHRTTCMPVNGRCAHHADCCSGACMTQVVRRGRQRVRVGHCIAAETCTGADASCDFTSECCDGLVCGSPGLGGGTCMTCIPDYGLGCVSDSDCCSGYTTCVNTQCWYT